MHRFGKWLRRLGFEESGVEHVQYAVAISLIVIAIIAGLKLLGNATNHQNDATSTMLQNAATAPGSSGS